MSLVRGAIVGAAVLLAGCGGKTTESSGNTNSGKGGVVGETPPAPPSTGPSSSAGGKGIGEPCTAASECSTNICGEQGTGAGGGNGGVRPGSFCSIPCSNPAAMDPEDCSGDAHFTGKCSGRGFCQLR